MPSIQNEFACTSVAVTDLVQELKRDWRAGAPADTAASLRDHPELLHHRSLVVDLAYEEFCLLEEAGTSPPVDEFCDRLPAFRSQVREALLGHQHLAAHPKLFAVQQPLWPRAGDQLLGLTVLGELGRGAFARVYLATDPATGDRPVALKLSSKPSREARTIGQVKHPHIADLYWARKADELHAICMEFPGTATLQDAIGAAFRRDGSFRSAGTLLDVIDLSDRLYPRRPIDGSQGVIAHGTAYPDAVASIFSRLAGALTYLHGRGIAHGDLKPSNVVLGTGGHPYLIDFNLATAGGETLLRCGGTLPYMAPERVRVMLGGAWDPAGAASSDVYSLGAVLFEALTGRVPFEPTTDPEMAEVASELHRRQLAGPPELEAEVPPQLARLVRRCLDPDPSRRPSAAAVRKALDRCLGRSDHRPRYVVAATILAALTAVSGYAARSPSHVPPPEPSPEDASIDATPATVPAPHPAGIAEAECVLRLGQVAFSQPRTHEEYFARGITLLREGSIDEARIDFLTAHRKKPSGRSAAFQAYCYRGSNAPLVSEALYRDAIKKFHYSEAWVHNNWAYTLTQLPRPTREQLLTAIDQSTTALKLDPYLRAALFNRSWARLLLHKYDQEHSSGPGPLQSAEELAAAQDDIQQVMASGPCDVEAYYKAAVITTVLGDGGDPQLERAVRFCRQAVLLGRSVASLRADPLLTRLAGRADFEAVLELDASTLPTVPPGLSLQIAHPFAN